MPNLIYLGNYNSVDTSENNWASEGAQSLVGISTNSSQMDIVNANVSDGGDGVVSDDDYGTNDYVQYYIDGQYFCTKTDSTMTANVTLTLSDGSTQVVEVVMMQQQNGDLFISDLLNCGTLDNLSIANVEISAITGDCYSGWYSDQSVDNTTLAPVTPNNDGYVDGTAGDDVIDGSYVDQDGDRVDANDQILPGAGEDDDYIRAGAGNDFVLAGDGDDEVYGGTGDDTLCGQDGDDTLFGEAGNDTLEGMNGNDIVYGGAGDDRITGDAGDDALTGGSGDDSISGGTGDDVIYGDRNGEDEATVAGRESFNWEGRSDSEIDGGYAMNTGSVTVTYDRIQDTGDHQSSLGDATLNTTGINSGGETVDNDSSLRSVTDGCGNEGAFSWDFSAPVENVSFNVNDIDGDGVVRILAYDANGNQIPVVLTGGNRLTLLDTDSVAGADTADSNGGYDDTNTSDYNLNVSIQGPVSRIVLEHDQDGDNNSGINVTDIYFDSTDTTGGNGADGNDVIAGGAGEDLIYGEGGADTISGGADDDTVYGGAGDDSISGNNGDDFLLGGDGDDNINGGNGDDTLCGGDGDDALTGGAGDDSLEGLPPYKTVGQAIEDILLKLLAEIHVPDQAREPWEKANDILSKGLNWYELAALLEQVALVVQYSLKVDQQELELFLQDLNSRLQLLHGGVENMGGINDSIQQCSNSLDANLREGISSLANDVNNASSLDALKASVLTSMDSVIGQLDEFQHEREDLQRQYQEHVASLSARIGELESSSDEVQKELQEQQRRSETDELTGLPNRSAYDRMISLEMARWHRYQQSFSLVVADIDFFKSINDEYGHLAGDKVLAVVAKTIRKRLRRVDFIARYGGEEFVVLLPSTSAVEACRLMEKLGTDIREAPFHYNKSPLRITVSFGIAEVTKQDDLEALFRRADTALYKAKALGRDRAVVGETE